MIIRQADHKDWSAIAWMIVDRSKGKVDKELALRRARQMVSRAHRRGVTAVVAVTPSDVVRGFLYAEERPAFDLTKMVFVEVHMLLGDRYNHPQPVALHLLQHLRKSTHKRILVQPWAFFGRLSAFKKLLRPMNPQLVSETYQL